MARRAEAVARGRRDGHAFPRARDLLEERDQLGGERPEARRALLGGLRQRRLDGRELFGERFLFRVDLFLPRGQRRSVFLASAVKASASIIRSSTRSSTTPSSFCAVSISCCIAWYSRLVLTAES